jgi:hypothetical protein
LYDVVTQTNLRHGSVAAQLLMRYPFTLTVVIRRMGMTACGVRLPSLATERDSSRRMDGAVMAGVRLYHALH